MLDFPVQVNVSVFSVSSKAPKKLGHLVFEETKKKVESKRLCTLASTASRSVVAQIQGQARSGESVGGHRNRSTGHG